MFRLDEISNDLLEGMTITVSNEVDTNLIKPYSGDTVNICDVTVKDNNITGVLYGSANPERVISIAQSGGMFNNFPDALAHAITLNPVSGNSVIIKCSPGTYVINDTLAWPGYVDFTADNANVIIAITDPTKNIIEFQNGTCIIDRLMVTGATSACGFVRNTSGNATLLWCQVFNCDIGIHCENSGSFMRLVTTGSPGGLNVFARATNSGQIGTTTVLARNCVTEIKADANGIVRLIDTIIEDCGTAYDLSNCVSEMSSCQVFNCTTGILAGTDSSIEGTDFNAFGCTTDINVAADITYFRLGNTKIDETKMIIADESKVSLNINDAFSRDKFFGTAAVFDIQQVDLFGTSDAGGNKPTLSRVVDNGGGVSSDLAIVANSKLDQKVVISNDASMVFNNDYTIEFWMRTDSGSSNTQYIITKEDTFEISWLRNRETLYWEHQKITTLTSDGNSIYEGSRIHIACVMDSINKKMIIYVNGEFNNSTAFSGTLTSNNEDIYLFDINNPGNHNFDGALDEINFWSKTLSASEVKNRYNSGNGLENTDLVNLMAGYHCNNTGTSTELIDYSGNGNTGTHDCSFDTGLILNTVPSIGLISWVFQSDKLNELFFNIHPNATYQEGKDIIPIIHWMPLSNNVGNIVWGLERSAANPGASYGNSTIDTITISTNGTIKEHIITEFPSFTLSDFRAIILGRLFRDGSNVADTFSEGVAVLGFELKFTKNKLGSDT